MNYGCDSYMMRELLWSRKHWLEKAEDVYTDKFVTAKELMKLYPCFTKSWLSSYGCYLYRTRAGIWDEEGNSQSTVWGYSLNNIKKKIEQGYIKCYVTIPYKTYFAFAKYFVPLHPQNTSNYV